MATSGGNGFSRNPYDSTPYYDPTRGTTNFNPTTAVVIISLIGGCFILAFVSVIIRKCMRDDTFPPPAMNFSHSRSSASAKPRGLDKAAVDALPLVHTGDLDERDEHECPVCLTGFEPEDSLRLLPTCKHVFHQECIDAWFDSHSTCPLCRASLLGYVGSAASGDAGAPRELVATITGVSESGDSDLELQRTCSVSPLEAAPQPSATISREDERSSAHGTLSRNSQSFKVAARGVAHEKGAASPPVPSSKNSSFRKPPLAPSPTTAIRRTSSLGADLIALRNLLMGAAGDQPHPHLPSYRLSATRSAVPTLPVPNPSAPSARARSLDLGSELRAPSPLRDPSRDPWVTIDLETGKASDTAPGPSSSHGEPSSREPAFGAAPERTWSERLSLASLRGAISRSSSDVASRLPL